MYIDTSSLVAFYVPEKITNQVDHILRNAESLSISSLTKIEFTSALNKKERTGLFSGEETNIALRKFEDHISKGLYNQIPISLYHYNKAEDLLLQTNNALRSLDAIHLGIVLKEKISIFSHDTVLLKSAEEFRIPTIKI